MKDMIECQVIQSKYVTDNNSVRAHVSMASHTISPVLEIFCGAAISVVLLAGSTYTTLDASTIMHSFDKRRLVEIANPAPLQKNCFEDNYTVPQFVELNFDKLCTIQNNREKKENEKWRLLTVINKEIPFLFSVTGIFFAILLVAFTKNLIKGIATGLFIMNPIYLIEISLGCIGMVVTSIAAIVEWRKKRDWKEREKR